MTKAKVQAEIELSTANAEKGFAKVASSAEKMSSAVKKSGKEAGDGLSGVGDGGDKASAKVDRATNSMIASIQRATVAYESGGRSTAKYYEAIANQKGISVDALRPYLSQLEQVSKTQVNTGVSAKQMANNLRGVPAQFTDIAVSLQGGQAPLTVFLQQGGQLKDMFGGIGPAAKALGGYVAGLINPFTLSAAAVGGLAYAFNEASNEQIAFQKSLVLTGNVIGLTQSQLAGFASSISDTTTTTQGSASSAIATMVNLGKVSGANLQKFTEAALKMESVLGTSVEDTAKKYADLAKSPIEASIKLNEQYNYLQAATLQRIISLQQQGKLEEAGAVAQEAYSSAFKKRAEEIQANLGLVSGAWAEIKNAASEGWDAILGVGRKIDNLTRDASPEEQLNKLLAEKRSLIKAQREAGGASTYYGSGYNDDIKSVNDQIKVLAKLGEQQAQNRAQTQADTITKAANVEVTKELLALRTKEEKLNDRKAAFLVQAKLAGTKQSVIDEALKAMEGEIKVTEKKIASLSKEENAYKSFMATVAGKIALSNAELESEGKLTDGQKLRVKFTNDLVSGKIKATEAEKEYARQLFSQLDANSALAKFDADKIARTKTIIEGIQKQWEETNKLTNAMQAYADSVEQANASAQFEATLIGKTDSARKLAIEKFKIEYELRKKIKEINESGVYEADKPALIKSAEDAAGKQVKTVEIKINTEEIDKAQKRLNAFLDPTKAQTFGDALKGAFGSAGDALGKLASQLQAYGIKEAEIAQAKEDAIKSANGDSVQLSKLSLQIAEKETMYRMGAFGDLTGAAAEFFDKQSKGYEIMSGISKAFHAAEIALQLESIAPKLASGAAAMFGQSGWGGFAGVAAMGAVMAGFGISSKSSSGAGMGAADMQKMQGTGSVFGNADAKSESISKSIDELSKTSNRLLPVNQSMLAALKSIESSMTGFTNLLARDQGVANGGNFGVKEGQISKYGASSDLISGAATHITKALFGPGLGDKIASMINNLWGKTTQKVTDSGVSFGGSLQALEAGKGFNQYASVDTTKSSWFGLKKSTTNSQLSQSLSDELSSQLGLVFGGMSDALKEANKLLGGNAAEIEATFASLVLSTEKISLKGLSGDALTQALNGVISKSLDEMAQAVFPQYDKFRELGEGYAQTVLRVANTFGTANQLFDEVGLALFKVGDAGVAAAMNFTKLVGGLENLQSLTSSYYENFFSEEERTANTIKALTAEFEKQNLVLPETKEGYRAIVEELARTGTPEQLSSILKLNDAFAGIASIAEEAAKSLVAERANLQQQLAELTQSASQQIAAQRAAIAESNRDVFDQIQAATLKKAVGDQGSGLQAELDNLTLTDDEKLKRQRDSLYEVNKAIFDQIQAEKAKIAALEASKLAAQEAERAEKERQSAQQAAFDAQYQAAKQIQEAWQAAADSIVDEVKRIRGIIDESQGTSLVKAQSQFAITTAQARSGDIDAAKLLPSLSKNLLDLTKENATSSLDLILAQARTAQSLEETLKLVQANRGGGLQLPTANTASYTPQQFSGQAISNEIIMPAAYGPANSVGNNDQLVQVLRSEIAELRTVVSSLLTATENGNTNTADIKKTLNLVTEGGRAMQTEAYS